MNVFDLFPGDNKLADNIAKAVKEDSWHAGDNAWSSEHDQWAKESVETIPALTGVSEAQRMPQQFDDINVTTKDGQNFMALVLDRVDGNTYALKSLKVNKGQPFNLDLSTVKFKVMRNLDEGSSYYYEELAQTVYSNNPELDTSGQADDLVSLGFEIAANEIGRKKARYLFAYDEDFASDFVSAYAHLQQGGARHLDEYKGAHDKVTFEVDSENAYNHIMQKYGNVVDWAGDYMTVPARYWPAVQELAFAAGGDVQEIGIDEGWKQNLAALGTAAALGAGGMAAFGGNSSTAPTSSGPELVNPQQVVQMIKAGKIANQQDLLSVIGKAKNKSTVWKVLQSQAGMEGSSDADAVVQTIAGNSVVREGASVQDLFNAITYRIERQMPELFTNYGVEVVADAIKDVAEFHEGAEELGSSDVGGMVREVVRNLKQQELRKALDEVKKMSTQQKFEKHLAKHGYDVNAKQKYWDQKIKDIDAQIAAWDAEMERRKQGLAEKTGDQSFDSMMKNITKGAPKQATADRKEQKKQSQQQARDAFSGMFGGGNPANKLGIREQGVAEGEYDDPRWEPREPDMSRKVDWDIEAQRNAPEEQEVPKTVTITDYDGNVVLTFPSTGGFYGDVRYAASKGIDTDSGDYHMNWKRDANESGQGDDSTSPIGGNVQESKYLKKLKQERFLKEHKKAFSLLDELKEVFKDK